MRFASFFDRTCSFAVVFGCVLIPTVSMATYTDGDRLEAEIAELKVAMNEVIAENEHLRVELASAEKSLGGMRASLANSGGETEVFKRQSVELKLRMEALGVDSASGNTAKLEQRLLTAVASLQSSAQDKRALTEALVRLSDSASLFARASNTVDPQSRLALEGEIRNATSVLGDRRDRSLTEQPSLVSATAVSVKNDLALVVMNLGSKQGIRAGMPFQVSRGDKAIALVTVVDVRDQISGAVIQRMNSEQDPVRVGDSLKIAAQ